jgi:Zn-dependent peptidase ImmA (M78 family)/transcriptional regulator with XRE-family HTH domain
MPGSGVPLDPNRLAQARRLRGYLKSDLAAAVGVTPAAISQFESGSTNPSAPTLNRLALALRIPPAFLVPGRPVIAIPEDETSFRSLRSTTKVQRSQARAQVELLAELVAICEEYLTLPTWDVTLARRGLDPEEAAAELREAWTLGRGPIASMVAVLEAHGVVVARLPASDRVDAFSCVIADRPFVLLASNKRAADRSRFDAAHELGHLLLHPDALPGLGRAELEAHRFASAFLMPRISITAELPASPSLGRLLELKQRWRVSVQALLRRGFDLGVYSEAAYRRAYQQLGRRGWRTDEPGDVGPPEQPQLMRRAAEMLAERYGDDFLARRTHLGADDLTSLLSMLAPGRPDVVLPPSDDILRAALIRKLDPSRFPNMSDRMAAVVGYILEQPFTEPAIAEMTVTSDGFVLAAREGDTGANELLGSRRDLDRNLVGLLNATLDLTEDEVALFGRLQRARITRW